MSNGIFIIGTDTGVGKTVVTAALAFALRKQGIDVGVMKPIATGCHRKNGSLLSEDAQALLRASGSSDPIDLVSPYRYEPPVAPWVAIAQSKNGDHPISLNQIKQAYQELVRRHEVVLVEGIGGLLVPIDRERTVADLVTHLGLPVLVVGRAGLGTINHTLMTLRAARKTGCRVLGVILNGRSLRPSLAERTNPRVIEELGKATIFGVIPRLKKADPKLVASHVKAREIFKSMRQGPRKTAARVRELSRIDRKTIWHPFTQMAEWEKGEPLIIERAKGAWLTDVQGNRYLDGISSLWVNIHGHRHPALDEALRNQIDQVAHSTLLGSANVPSIELAQELVRIAPKGLTRVFYSDNGSTAVEVALKMAFQYCQQNGAPKRRRFVHFVNAYHGDTIGSVSVGGIDLFHKTYGSLLFKGFKVPYGDFDRFEETIREHHREIAGVVVEPVIQGAAGMLTHPKGWLKKVERLCRRHRIFLIADEVAVGFGRTGKMFACEWENVQPDFLCLAKGLTGGYLPLAATLATEKVYRGFLGKYEEKRTFFHGHSYTGNPLACAVALENLRIFQRQRVLQKLQSKIQVFARELERFKKLPKVTDIRHRGFVAGIELDYPWEAAIGAQVCLYLRGRGILLRPLGSVVVLLPPLSISPEELRFLCRETYDAIERVTG